MLPSPLLYLSAFFEATRADYYERLRGVTERGEWEDWLGYFLTGSRGQAEDALGRVQRINDLLARWRARPRRRLRARGGRRRPSSPRTPIGPRRGWPQRLDVAFTTAQRTIRSA